MIGVEACGLVLVARSVVLVDVEVVVEVRLIDCGTVLRVDPHAARRNTIATEATPGFSRRREAAIVERS